jgi:predicted RNase H-like HicB family nuclease
MTEVVVIYHHEGDAWWAESKDVPGFSAAASSLPELRVLTREGLSFHLDEAVDLLETMAGSAGVVASVEITSTVPTTEVSWTPSSASVTTVGAPGHRVVAATGCPWFLPVMNPVIA